MSSIAERFKQARDEQGMSQYDLAACAGVSQQTVNAIEQGRIRRPRNILSLSRCLKSSPDWLIYGFEIGEKEPVKFTADPQSMIDAIPKSLSQEAREAMAILIKMDSQRKDSEVAAILTFIKKISD
ncbi:helix-turn-helix domain-containing protein [Agarivorans sp. B2Z047]|uniref:helix-turn-helix domain-containing protein n=1 Tax=Agarivorans sp. B2Z047 TaxID=2652721 RepID=UPI00128B321F|nr:helix-turn-helix transcriptional regulator [Agarivorans sp. B2Z047]MPW31942.1 helix-turn-helix domain-containing protein [Agarivorans sp. B2Z047]UQN41911.1 helix-turn-helix domain-containing protein [Agarivorans sp. B2Z047]